MTTEARIAATNQYLEAEARLRKAARNAAATGRPTLSADLRWQAGLVRRAVLAEEQDPIPHGFASFEPLDHDSREGR